MTAKTSIPWPWSDPDPRIQDGLRAAFAVIGELCAAYQRLPAEDRALVEAWAEFKAAAERDESP